MFKGTIRAAATPYFEAADGTRLPLAKAPAGSDGKPAVYGMRPEHLSIGGDMKIAVHVTEPTGAETQVVGKIAGQTVVGVFRERIGSAPGDMLAVSPDLAAIHLFDAESGMRLS
jgi:multiple sugar transport system ATP-binding protein